MILPALQQAREKARRINCKANLRQIGVALRMYTGENNAEFPKEDGDNGLQYLITNEYLIDAGVYVCQSTAMIADTGIPNLTDGDGLSYEYIANAGNYSELTAGDESALCLDGCGTNGAHENSNHFNYGNVVFGDGHAGSFTGSSWRTNTNNIPNSSDFDGDIDD